MIDVGPVQRWRYAFALLTALVMLGSTFGPSLAQAAPEGEGVGIHKIKHVIMIMQENRSFDEYFGTYPGADGIPGNVCVPDPVNGGCDKPYHDPADQNFGGPHGTKAFEGDIDGGLMDGFVAEVEGGKRCTHVTEANCSLCQVEHSEAAERFAKGSTPTCVDVMGYHDAREIPNYWAYAHNFVLQDHLFEAARSWSLPEHLFMVSAWSALCKRHDPNPLDCKSSLSPDSPSKTWDGPAIPGKTQYAWTDITYLMDKAHVSWRYFVTEGDEPDCEDDEELTCEPVKQTPGTPGIWEPLVDFTDVKEDNQEGNIQGLNHFFEDAHQTGECGLPNVSWIVPNLKVSEHPPSLISTSQTYVTTLINTIMKSPCWKSSAIFLSWDDPGGYYDHVDPPDIDVNGYGLRVPGLTISPYAKSGFIDKQQLSHDSYLKFIEDDFIDKERLDPKTDGRPDGRPDVREEAPGLGDIVNDFNFEQSPRPPVILPTHPEPGPASNPPGEAKQPPMAVTMNPTAVEASSATLNATVNPNGAPVSDCRFEYGQSTPYSSSAPCAPSPGEGESAVAVSAHVTGLALHKTYHFRVRATTEFGTSFGEDETFQTGASLPERGRCVPKTTKGEYTDAACTMAGKTGAFEWLPGAGATGYTVQGGSLTFETASKRKIVCNGVSGSGSYTSPKTEVMHLTLNGCEQPEQGACHDEKATSGEILLSPLEGVLRELGASGAKSSSVGTALRSANGGEANFAAFICGNAGYHVVIGGSVIAMTSKADKMSSGTKLEFIGKKGRQTPEVFEGGNAQRLTVSFDGEGFEGASLHARLIETAQEPLEIKATG